MFIFHINIFVEVEVPCVKITITEEEFLSNVHCCKKYTQMNQNRIRFESQSLSKDLCVNNFAFVNAAMSH